MKTLLISLLIASNCLAQNTKLDFQVHNCSPIKNDFLWAAKTELSNYQYLEFLSYVKKDQGIEAYKKLLPDTTVWKQKLSYSEPYVEYYFRHPAYRSYPLVGVSKQQAEAYCEWLEVILNDRYSKDSKHPVKKVDVRLPTDKEWQLAARGGNPNAIFPWDGEEMRRIDKKWAGQMRANFVRGQGNLMGFIEALNDYPDVTAPILSYWPNAFGLYNMSGNVAEMVQENGRTRGGSWKSRAPFLEIDGVDEHKGFTEPNARIGFRYFIEIVSFKPTKPTKNIDLTAKLIEELLQPVSSNKAFMISKYEVTNQLYNLFLQENSNKKHASNNSLWNTEMDYPKRIINNYTTHPKYSNYPVVNITKEDAVAFCNWLTNKYNSFSKKKHNNLEFRLPTTTEWEIAAKGGLDLSPYPWGGPYMRNARGARLCNYAPPKDRWINDKDPAYIVSGVSQSDLREAANQDGFLITAPVDSYHPNNYGTYCMSGNVAEMVADKAIVKGGSWGSYTYFTQINASEKYTGASPYVGFRFVASQPKDNMFLYEK